MCARGVILLVFDRYFYILPFLYNVIKSKKKTWHCDKKNKKNPPCYTLTWGWSSLLGTAVWLSGSWLVGPGLWARVWGCSPSRRCRLQPWPWCSSHCAFAGTGSHHPCPAERNRSSHPEAPVWMRWDNMGKREPSEITPWKGELNIFSPKNLWTSYF